MLWLLMMRSSALWVGWMYAYRCKGVDLWSMRIASSSSWAWRRILKLRLVFQPLMGVPDGVGTWKGRKWISYFVHEVWNSLRHVNSKVSWFKLLWGNIMSQDGVLLLG
ncbi:unnamed protein product [Linum trigynum]|uniref:Secreted protein n=1 Tax=Linum trigynum TaxID=586398 RepID=A0AAV2D289_9ROSI